MYLAWVLILVVGTSVRVSQVIAIDEDDRWARELNDVDDVERLLPGTLDAIREWFRTYKVPDGKPENK